MAPPTLLHDPRTHFAPGAVHCESVVHASTQLPPASSVHVYGAGHGLKVVHESESIMFQNVPVMSGTPGANSGRPGA
jgi:hypothetical protein